MKAESTKIAEEIFKLIGHKDNILLIEEGLNRVKLTLRDKKRVNVGILKNVEGVLGIVETPEQLQILFENERANELIDEFMKFLGL